MSLYQYGHIDGSWKHDRTGYVADSLCGVLLDMIHSLKNKPSAMKQIILCIEIVNYFVQYSYDSFSNVCDVLIEALETWVEDTMLDADKHANNVDHVKYCHERVCIYHYLAVLVHQGLAAAPSTKALSNMYIQFLVSHFMLGTLYYKVEDIPSDLRDRKVKLHFDAFETMVKLTKYYMKYCPNHAFLTQLAYKLLPSLAYNGNNHQQVALHWNPMPADN
jgi:hypothetical protein